MGSLAVKKHPPMCGYFTSHNTTRRVGCRKGKDCHKYHPPIYRNSEIKRECLNEGCDLIHLKNTRRKPGILHSGTTQEQQQKSRKEEKRRTWSDVVQNRNRRLQGSQSSATSRAKDSTPFIPASHAVDQDFLIHAMGTLSDGIPTEIKSEIQKMLTDQLGELKMEIAGRSQMKCMPSSLVSKNISPESMASTTATPWTYQQMIQQYHNLSS